MLYILGIIGAIIVGLSLSLYTQTVRLDDCSNKHENFVAEVDIKTKQAKVDGRAKELEFHKILGDKNVEYEAKLFSLNNTINQLRKQRNSPSSSVVPAATNDKSAGLPKGYICFDREELDRAQSESEAEAEEIAIAGTKTTLQYSCAVDWINKLNDLDTKGAKKDGNADNKD